MPMRLKHDSDMRQVRNLADYVKMESVKRGKKLRLGIMQMYSMRSYTMSYYNLLLDGNLNATLHMLYDCGDYVENVHITAPKDVELKQLIKLREFIDKTYKFNVTIGSDDFCNYGINAAQSREQADTRFDVNSMIESMGLDLCICDFEKTVYSLSVRNIDKIVYRFNVSYSQLYNPSAHLLEMEPHQRYVAEHGFPTFVLNSHQLEYYKHSDTDTEFSNLILQRGWFNMLFMLEHQLKFFTEHDSRISSQIQKEIEAIKKKSKEHGAEKIAFHPFRLSDPEYQANSVISRYLDEGYIVVVSDSNNSVDKVLSREITSHPLFHELRCDETAKKSFMYNLFEGALGDKVYIPYSQKIEHVAHQMFLEMWTAQEALGNVHLVGRVAEDPELLRQVIRQYVGAQITATRK